jgi:hypothetical protein
MPQLWKTSFSIYFNTKPSAREYLTCKEKSAEVIVSISVTPENASDGFGLCQQMQLSAFSMFVKC